jgi:membrane protease YdiL (CAAX protease family)
MQAAGEGHAAVEAMRQYVLTALFPLVLAALTWSHLRSAPPARTGGPRAPLLTDLAWGVGLASLTLVTVMVYSYGASRLGWVRTGELGASARLMRTLVDGLPAAPFLLLLLTGVLAPLAEEGFFRGLLYRGVRRLQPHDYRIAVLVSSLTFALLHPAAHFPVLFLMGTLLALVVERTGRLRPAIFAHALHNTATTILFLVSTGGAT